VLDDVRGRDDRLYFGDLHRSSPPPWIAPDELAGEMAVSRREILSAGGFLSGEEIRVGGALCSVTADYRKTA
jgi:hypothetical protein